MAGDDDTDVVAEADAVGEGEEVAADEGEEEGDEVGVVDARGVGSMAAASSATSSAARGMGARGRAARRDARGGSATCGRGCVPAGAALWVRAGAGLSESAGGRAANTEPYVPVLANPTVGFPHEPEEKHTPQT